MDHALFQQFRRIAREHAGIEIRDGKEALVEARIAKRRRVLGIDNARRYLEYIKADETGQEVVNYLNVITTNHTGFFREPDHFAHLGACAREWIARGASEVRVWSVASSTGEEPFTIAMTVAEAAGGDPARCRVLATDISTTCLAAGERGEYTGRRLEPVPRMLRAKYFTAAPSPAGGERMYRVRDGLRAQVTFRRLNLSEPPYPMKGPFDAIFCRNVMIYLRDEVRRRLTSEIERLLRPGGILCIGHAETLGGMAKTLRAVEPSLYRKPAHGTADHERQ